MNKALTFLAFVFLAAGMAPLRAQEILDAPKEKEKALVCEGKYDWKGALLRWERVLDRCEASAAERQEALKRVRDLRLLVPAPNADPKAARPWRTIVLVFENLDLVSGKGTKSMRAYRSRISETDFANIQASFAKFGEQVLRSTSGIVRIDAEFVRVKEPLTDLAGEPSGGFWLDPARARPFVPAQDEGNPYQSVFAFVKMTDEKGAQIPVPFWGGTYGGDLGPGGAGYTNICWISGTAPEGELEFHEWMHQIDWMFAAVLGYPDEFVPNPDSGRKAGESGGDPCYRRKPGETSWMGFYRHIAEEHITRLMWSEAGMFSAPTCPMQPLDFSRWLVLGPLKAPEGKNALLDPFLEEATLQPKEGEAALGKTWRRLTHEGRALDLGHELGNETGSVAYAFARVRSPQAREAKLWLGSDDGVRVWVNGRLVHSVDLARVLQLDLDRIPVHLQEGWNSFLFKVDNRGGGWFLQARLVDAEGRSLRDLEQD